MRNKYWQEVRGYLIILVIIIHTLYFSDSNVHNVFNIFLRTLINFAVPCFLFLSGLFSNYTKSYLFYKKKIIRLIIPLIVWSLFYTIIGNINNNISIKSIALDIILARKAGHLYYIYVLFQLYILLPFLNKLSKTQYKYIPIFLTLASNILFFILSLHFPSSMALYKYLIFGWISYFYLGIIVKEKQIQFNKKVLLKLLPITILLVITINIILYYKGIIKYELIISQFSIMNYFYSMLVICIIYFYSNIKKKINGTIVKIGDYSYGIYLSHLVFILVLKDYLLKTSNNYFVNIFLIFAITLVVSFIICHMYYKIKPERRINNNG